MSQRLRLRDLGAQIDELCDEHGIFRKDIADKMGVSHPYISQIISRGGTANHIEQIAKALAELGVQVAGEPVDANYFDRYSGLVILDEARAGDEGATVALMWYNAYRKLAKQPKKQKAMLTALERLKQ